MSKKWCQETLQELVRRLSDNKEVSVISLLTINEMIYEELEQGDL